MSIPPTPEGLEPVWIYAVSIGEWVPGVVAVRDGSLAFTRPYPLQENETIIACSRDEGDDSPPDFIPPLPGMN